MTSSEGLTAGHQRWVSPKRAGRARSTTSNLIIRGIDALTWSRIRRWLFYAEEKSFFILAWAVPILVACINYIREQLGYVFPLPEMLVSAFLIAIAYVSAQTLYLVFCPYKIKNIKDDRDWLVLYTENMNRVNVAMEAYRKARQTAQDIVEFYVDQSGKTNPSLYLNPEHLESFKKIITDDYLARGGSMPPFVDDIRESSYGRMRELDKERRSARLLTALLIFSAICGSLYETGSKVAEVVQAAF